MLHTLTNVAQLYCLNSQVTSHVKYYTTKKITTSVVFNEWKVLGMAFSPSKIFLLMGFLIKL